MPFRFRLENLNLPIPPTDEARHCATCARVDARSRARARVIRDANITTAPSSVVARKPVSPRASTARDAVRAHC